VPPRTSALAGTAAGVLAELSTLRRALEPFADRPVGSGARLAREVEWKVAVDGQFGATGVLAVIARASGEAWPDECAVPPPRGWDRRWDCLSLPSQASRSFASLCSVHAAPLAAWTRRNKAMTVCTSDPTRERRMGEVVRANARPLLHFLLRQTRGQYEQAEDLLQETMLRAWRRVDELPADPVAARRWLYTVARNLAIDWLRARSARPPEVYGIDLTSVQSADPLIDSVLDRYELDDALGQLTPEHRTVLVDLYYDGASVAEVSARTGIPSGTVRSRCFYALRAARAVLTTQASA